MKAIWTTTLLTFMTAESAELCLDHLRSVGADDVCVNEDKTTLSGRSYNPEFAKIIKDYTYGSFGIKNIIVDSNGAKGSMRLYSAAGQEMMSIPLDDVLDGLVVKPKQTMIIRIDSGHPMFENSEVAEIRSRFQADLDNGETLEDIKRKLRQNNENDEYDFAIQSTPEHVHEINNFDLTDYYIQLEIT